MEIFKALPKPLPIPVLLVQHISRGFEDGFARWLSKVTGQSINIAVNGQLLTAGVWMSCGGQHLRLSNGRRVELVQGLPTEIHCPSGNPMFQSLAPLGSKAAGVLLTGMGDDGAQGLLELKQSGGVTIIQNQPSCLIWGMPKVAQQLGAAGFELDPSEIATALIRMIF
jgi:two-component system, chemotaxis family, protein-glutamate methylesterase/glutaminase